MTVDSDIKSLKQDLAKLQREVQDINENIKVNIQEALRSYKDTMQEDFTKINQNMESMQSLIENKFKEAEKEKRTDGVDSIIDQAQESKPLTEVERQMDLSDERNRKKEIAGNRNVQGFVQGANQSLSNKMETIVNDDLVQCVSYDYMTETSLDLSQFLWDKDS